MSNPQGQDHSSRPWMSWDIYTGSRLVPKRGLGWVTGHDQSIRPTESVLPHCTDEDTEVPWLPFLAEILVVPREKTPTGAAARGNPGDAPVLAS